MIERPFFAFIQRVMVEGLSYIKEAMMQEKHGAVVYRPLLVGPAQKKFQHYSKLLIKKVMVVLSCSQVFIPYEWLIAMTKEKTGAN